MRHKPQHYAEALYGALEGKADSERGATLKRLAVVLRKNRDMHLLNSILKRYEKLFLAKRGLRKVEVESARPLSEKLKKEVEAAAGGPVLISEKVNPDLVAGLILILNDSVLIDASAKSKITRLFA